MNNPILEVKNLNKYFHTKHGQLHAVDNVSFKVYEGETMGVVGESGCGKSTLGRSVIRLLPITSGQIIYKGVDISKLPEKKIHKYRRDMQIIFQDPYSSLNPRMNISQLIAEPIIINKLCSNRKEINKKVAELMDTVGISHRLVDSYPHNLDGGQRQRVGIARALAVEPNFIVCDEPVSALDVSIQAQILNLLMDLQDKLKISYLFITHDLSVVKHISKSIMVMYMGNCVEKAPTEELFANPLHPYTKALFSAILLPEPDCVGVLPEVIQGEVSNPINPLPGCRFAPRCKYACEMCTSEQLLQEKTKDHWVACWRCFQ